MLIYQRATVTAVWPIIKHAKIHSTEIT